MSCLKFHSIYLSFFVLITHVGIAFGSLIVETPFGKLEGTNELSRDGRTFSAFRGIPYAQKPERFQIAKLVEPWNDELKMADKFGNACPQFDFFSKTELGHEDCLFLNVYTPTMKSDEKLPVMVYFHGGSFVFGKSDDMGPKYFMDEDVILVTVNYRLGVFGFLTTGNDNMPGNVGMRDQVLSLHWVQRTISAFGGDPDKVTIFGNSAGAASCQLISLSPLSKGLFRNVIAMGGSAFGSWPVDRNPLAKTKEIARNLGCSIEDLSQLHHCLNEKSVDEIIQAQKKLNKWNGYPVVPLSPVVEPEESAIPRFLEDHPFSLISSGKINKASMMYGFNEDEGIFLSAPLIRNETAVTEISEQWANVTSILLDYEDLAPTELRDNVTQKILEQYFGKYEDINEETWDSFTQLLSDRYFVYPADKGARALAKHMPVYPYVFAFPNMHDSPVMKTMFGISGDHGVGHADELQYLFNGFCGAEEYTETVSYEAYELSKRFVKVLASFARDNEPTSLWKNQLTWDPVSPNIGDSPINYYLISSTTSYSDEGLKERMKFWDDLNIDAIQHKKEHQIRDEL